MLQNKFPADNADWFLRNLREKIKTILKLNVMKKILLLLLGLSLLAASCATQKSSPQTPLQGERGAVQPAVYYTGNSEPAASSGVVFYSGEQ
jgi:hypothetical protein